MINGESEGGDFDEVICSVCQSLSFPRILRNHLTSSCRRTKRRGKCARLYVCVSLTTDSVCLAVYVANGHVMAFSLPSLRLLLDNDYLPFPDVRLAICSSFYHKNLKKNTKACLFSKTNIGL